ncbi:MAG: integrase [Candidatus Woesearchaeota archaeon]|jgi:intergrase/recombinase|nr:integrase [Candidatus Woesearchaeota archaeon]
MKERVNVTLDKSLLNILKERRIKLSSHINQLLWRELALENDKEHFHKFNNIEYKNESWQFKDKDNEMDKDFKYLYHIYVDKYDEFHEWLNKHSKGYKKNITNVLKNSFKNNYRNFRESLRKGKYSAKYYSLAFRNLINYAVEEDLLKKSESIDIKDKLKLYRSGMDFKVPGKNEVIKLLNKIKEYNILDYIFVRLLFESGLRISDVKFFLKTFTRDNVEILKSIFICPLYHFRGSKSSFYCLALNETFNLLLKNYDDMKNYNEERLKTHIKRNNLLSLKYLRKYNFTLMIEYNLNFEIANFIQGRASQDIGFNHYLAKKKLATTEYMKIQKELKTYHEKLYQ